VTAQIDESTRSALESGDIDHLTTTFGLIVVVLLLLLLIERELLRGYDREGAERARRIRFIVLPLVLVTVAVLGARFASLAV
jgi:hypothetical protein